MMDVFLELFPELPRTEFDVASCLFPWEYVSRNMTIMRWVMGWSEIPSRPAH